MLIVSASVGDPRRWFVSLAGTCAAWAHAILRGCVLPLRSLAGDLMQRLAPLRDVLQLSAQSPRDARLPEVLAATADACRDIAHTVSQVAIRDLGGVRAGLLSLSC